MKSLEELKHFWEKSLKKELGSLKKQYKEQFPSVGKYWAMAILPIPVIAIANGALLFGFADVIPNGDLVLYASMIWVPGFAVIVYGVLSIFRWTKNRDRFMLDVKKRYFSRCIDFLECGLSYSFDSSISEERLRDSALFDRYSMLSGEDQFSGEANHRKFSFSEVALNYFSYTSHGRTRKQRREIKNFIIFEFDAPDSAGGRLIVYPGDRTVQERKALWKGELRFSLLLLLMNAVTAFLFKSKGPRDPLGLHLWKVRSLYHLSPPDDMQCRKIESGEREYTVMYENEADLRTAETELGRLDQINDLAQSELFLSKMKNRTTLAVSGHHGNMTTELLEFDEDGKNINRFEPFAQMHRAISLQLKIAELFTSGDRFVRKETFK